MFIWKSLERLNRQGFSEQKLVHGRKPPPIGLLPGRFYAFRNHLHAEFVRHGDHRLTQHRIVGTGCQIAYEILVYFDVIDIELPEIKRETEYPVPEPSKETSIPAL